MKDEHKTKEELINELVEMRRRISELETSKTRRKRVNRGTARQGPQPHILTMKNRGLLNLSIVLITSVIFALFNISVNFTDKLYSFLDTYTSFPIAEFLTNLVFLWLAGLLWLTYCRWRSATKTHAELDNIISSISPDVLMVVDSDRNITMCNASVKRMFGYEVDEVIDQKVDFICSDKPSETEHWHDIFETLKKDGFHIGSATGKGKNGETIPLEIITGDLSGRGGAVLLLRDITERKQAEEKLRSLSITDELTGLYNRRGFFTLAEQQLKLADRMKRGMLLLFADLDNLKWINDTFGHDEGDLALIEIANILKETFRKSDITARIGGDEFVVLAIEAHRNSANILTTRLQENLKAHNAKRGRGYELSLSMGIARYDPESPCPIDKLISLADKSMYQEKRSKQNS